MNNQGDEMNNIKVKTLDCGVRVIMEKLDQVQSASFGIWVKAGAVDEEKEISGVSHFIEHMMFKGTETRSAKDIAADIDKIGGQFNAFTGKEATCYYVKTVGNNILKGADVILDMLNNSVFDKVELGRERKVILEEMKMTQDTPDDLAQETVIEQLFKGNPYGNSIIGNATSLKGINRDKLVAYKEREYTKNAIVVSIAGNFDEDAFLEFLNGKFSRLKDYKAEKKTEIAPYQPTYKVIKKDINQTHICLATKGVSIDDDRYYALTLLNSVMGGSMSSRLFQNIREQKGLAYSVFSVCSSAAKDGYFEIYAGVNSDKIAAALNGIREELDILNKNGITSEELSMAKEQAKAAYVFGQENAATRMFVNGKNLILVNKVYESDEILAGYDAVTLEDIEKIKDMICNIETYTGVSVSDIKYDLRKNWLG